MRIEHNKELDVIEIIFREPLNDRSVYGSEDEPGVVVFRGTETDEIYSIEILFSEEYPDVWGKSLISLLQEWASK